MLLVLMNNYVARCKMLHALSVYPIKKTLGVRGMFLVCPGTLRVSLNSWR
jgi:hypothetical protein